MKVKTIKRKMLRDYPDIFRFMNDKQNQIRAKMFVIKHIKRKYNIVLINQFYSSKEIAAILRRYMWEMIQENPDYIRYRLML